MTHISKLISLIVLLLAFFSWPTNAASPSLTFSPERQNVALGDQFTVNILVNTVGFDSGGVGAKINFNPEFLSATGIEPGNIFADYPTTIIDNQTGKIIISAIAGSPTELFNGNGQLATINLKAIKAGTSQITFHFEPGQTTDSNIAVMFGNGDILGTVNKFEAIINEEGQLNNEADDTVVTPVEEDSFLEQITGLLNLPSKQTNTVKGRQITLAIDPNKPLTRQPPITSISQNQPNNANVAYVSEDRKPALWQILTTPEIIAGASVSLMALVIFIYFKRLY